MGNGGSQGSGAVSYPDYMETQHELWLDDVADLIDIYIDSSPYADEDAYSLDDDGYATDIENDLALLRSSVDTFNIQGHWNSFIQDAVSSRDEVYSGIDDKVKDIDIYAQGQARNFVDEVMSQNEWEALIAKSKDELSMIKFDSESDAMKMNEYMQGQVTNYIDNILSGSTWEELVSRVRSELTTIKSDASTDASTLMSSSGDDTRDQILESDNTFDVILRNRISSMLIEAIDLTYSSNIDSIVDEDVEAFEQSALPEHNRSMARFAAQMCDIGAVHTSAFIVGQAMMEDQFTKSLQARRSEVKERIIGAALNNYMQSYMQGLLEYVRLSAPTGKDYIDTYFQNMRGDSEFILNAVNGVMDEFKQELNAKVAMFVDGYRSYVSSYLDGIKTDSASLYGGVESAMNRLNSEMSNKASLYSSGYNAYLGANMEYEKFKSLYIVNANESLFRLLNLKLETEKNLAIVSDQVYRGFIIAKTEETNRNVELDVLDAQYPFELYQYGGNILASIAGAAHTVNRPQSPAQVALAGAAAGAGIGTAIAPGIGTAIGAGVGALASLL